MTLTTKQQFIAWVTGGALLVTTGLWYSFFPLRQTLQAKRTKILEARITVELNSRQQRNLSALKKQVEEIQKNTETLNAAFFDRTKALEFLEYIESLADSEKLSLTEPQLTEPTRTPTDTTSSYTIEEKPFQFNLQGPVPALMRFLQTIETHSAYILIHTVALQKAQTGEGTLSLEGTIPWH